MNLTLWTLVFSLCCVVASGSANASENQNAGILTGANGLNLGYLEDPTSELAFAEITDATFTPVTTATVNFGFTESAYWFRAQADSLQEREWVLDIGYPPLEKIDVYHLSASGVNHFTAGNHVAADGKLISDRTYAFPIEHEPGKPFELFIRTESAGAMQVPITLWSQSEFHAHDHREQLILGFYYGILLAAILYNLLLAITTRESVLLLYCIYVSSFLLFQFSINGLGTEYLWPRGSTLSTRAIPIFMIATCVSAIVFIRSLLRLKQFNKTLHRIGSGLLIPFCVIAFFVFSIEYQILIKVLTTLALACSVYVFYCGTIVYIQIKSYARYVVIGWSAFFVGVLIYGLKTWGLLPHNLFTEYAVQAGSAIEVILFSFAIADRFIKLRDENIRIQTEATATLEAKVNDRTLELRTAIEQLANANQKLETLNAHDTLSGVYSRSYFNNSFEHHWNLAIRQKSELSLLMIDIDHFKNINDTHGHLAGDSVIIKVAELISSVAKRSTDIVARYGGEEFIVLLPETNLTVALNIAENIRNDVCAALVPYEDQMIRVTVSIGIAHEVASDSTDRFKVIANADNALYTAKNQGRNRVCMWQPQPFTVSKVSF